MKKRLNHRFGWGTGATVVAIPTTCILWIFLPEFRLQIFALASEMSLVNTRLVWWLSPPLFLAALIFLGQALFARAQAANLNAQMETLQHTLKQGAENATVEAEKAHTRFTLEVRGLGITVDRFRQGTIWQRIDKVNNQFQSILSQDPNNYEWGASTRSRYYGIREGDAFEAALSWWGERWTIPTLVASPIRENSPAPRINRARQSAGLGIHLFTVLDTRQGEGADALVAQMFEYFDRHPELPAAVFLVVDGPILRPDAEFRGDRHFVPSIPDSVVTILVTRSDRVDRDIRPYAVDVPYNINLYDTRYDVIKLWNDYWNADTDYHQTPNHHEVMPVEFWNKYLPTLLSKIDPNGSQASPLAFWERGTKGFKPSSWVPIRWTKWQLKEYDDAPLLGYLHRPIEVALSSAIGPQHDSANAAAMAMGWQQALATLPEGTAAQRLFFDTGNEPRHIIPFARAMSQEHTPHPLAINDPAASYDIGQRIGNTGVSSPFVQLALGLMRSYDKGGASATVNLRQPDRASIIMVSPPDDARKARNPRAANPFRNPTVPGL